VANEAGSWLIVAVKLTRDRSDVYSLSVTPR
jgi:hypothetical protein